MSVAFSVTSHQISSLQNNEFYWWKKANSNSFRTSMFCNLGKWNTWRVDMCFSVQHFSVHYCSCWQYSDPRRPSQGVFPSSAVQTLVNMSGHNWSLRWSYYRASRCCLLDVSGLRTMESLLLHIYPLCYYQLYFVFSIFAYNECNWCGRTSRPVVRTEI